ncbi:DUF1289 domain-containing protein [Vreelandella gomseomensis]|uniref:DUF1289 domain-containing protein n=1 Tax=Vreelandella gomseomensis TaxID=370766 RepID=A0ABU1GF35_9GAMM|nr:DUF1289 domain-containing protein [Halomonas gomseomensis]MDR5876099.1 DUF1289 domain-containing protein [Halomonas gomseomensis]
MTSSPSSFRPLSPCRKICRVVPDQSLCEGCGRTLDEIARWGQMTEAEKAPVWKRLDAEGYSVSSGSSARGG